jgi:tRNA U55 pseudouridine synthase TruB
MVEFLKLEVHSFTSNFEHQTSNSVAVNIFEEGQVLLIDKPIEWTSFDVVRKIRNLIRIKKVGHAAHSIHWQQDY